MGKYPYHLTTFLKEGLFLIFPTSMIFEMLSRGRVEFLAPVSFRMTFNRSRFHAQRYWKGLKNLEKVTFENFSENLFFL